MKIEPLTNDHLQYMWAAYQKGGLSDLGDGFEAPNGVGWKPQEFSDVFVQTMLDTFDHAWVVVASTENGRIPVGLFTGYWPREDAAFVVIKNLIWFPWASARNKVEGAVKFFGEVRHEVPVMVYAREKRLFEIVAQHGIMRRVGTSHNVYAEGSTALFETRTPDGSVRQSVRREFDQGQGARPQ